MAWQVQSFREDAGLDDRIVHFIDFDNHHSVWLAVTDGRYHFDGYDWQRSTTRSDLRLRTDCQAITFDAYVLRGMAFSGSARRSGRTSGSFCHSVVVGKYRCDHNVRQRIDAHQDSTCRRCELRISRKAISIEQVFVDRGPTGYLTRVRNCAPLPPGTIGSNLGAIQRAQCRPLIQTIHEPATQQKTPFEADIKSVGEDGKQAGTS